MPRKPNQTKLGNRPLTARPPAGKPPIPPPGKPIPPGRKWLFRLAAAVLLPLLLLAGLELALRVAGYGYSTDFFKPATIAGRDYLVENDQFGLRFFPASLARIPSPVVMPAKKAPDTIRIFIFGESAAQGDPRPNYGAGRYLETLLHARFPGTKFEVVNTSVTAINSHVILPIARECTRYEGDVWIVYMGNNEMVGPFGAATVFGAQAPPLALVRFNLLLQKTRVGQLLVALAGHLRQRTSGPTAWHGMEMFRGNQVPPDDPRKSMVYRNFGQNLADILHPAHPLLILNTVAVNLLDCPPFASWCPTNLPPAQQVEFAKQFQAATNALAEGKVAGAAGELAAAAENCPKFANLEFQLADCLLQQTNYPRAREHFQRSLDLDALPFRADSRINGMLAEAAKKFAGPNLVFCDAAAVLAAATPTGIPGDDLFYEHVHLNFNGNYRLARTWAELIQQQLKARLGPPTGEWLAQDQCERRLGLTDWNRISVLEEIAQRLQGPPFTDQPGNSGRLAGLKKQISDMRARLAAAPAAEAAQVYESALAGSDDYRLHENFAEFLEATHDPRAVAERQKVCDRIPHFYFPFYRLGLDLLDQGRLDEALQAFTQAAALRPDQADVRLELGIVQARQGQWAAALAELDRARKLAPEDPHASLYAGEVLWKLNRHDDSIASLREAVRLQPEYWEAHYRLGDELAQQADVAAAAAEFAQVVRINPNYVKAHTNLGVALFKLGRVEEAVAEFDAALLLDPQNPQALAFKQQVLNRTLK